MSIQIFHGDDQANSRKHLNLALDKFRSSDILIHYLDGNKLTRPELETSLSTANLYSQEAVVIENLISRVRSKEKEKCLNLLTTYKGPKNLVFWDKKELTKTQLKVFPTAQVKLAKTPVIIWKLLDTLSPSSRKYSLDLLHQTLEEADAGFVFIMLARRISNLIIAKSGDSSKLSPWLRSRLISQAKPWDQNKLIEFHALLTDHDYKLKTGGTKLGYEDILDICLATLLD